MVRVIPMVTNHRVITANRVMVTSREVMVTNREVMATNRRSNLISSKGRTVVSSTSRGNYTLQLQEIFEV